MALTTEQMVLINNLMYIDSSSVNDCPLSRPTPPTSVKEWINNIDCSKLVDNADYGGLTSGEDWKKVIDAVKNDETIMNMQIEATHVDNTPDGGGGFSAVLVSKDTGDAVVAFAGTAGDQEWKDNFMSGNTADTPIQKNALEWYQDAYKDYDLGQYEVTVTGHSKGGNKSKYIALLDETVDHCVSFDGEGFSDKFMEKYADEIAMRQSKIQNHNVDYDYVNILLNDVGEKTYYKGQNYNSGDTEFLENHCMNTFMKYDNDGNFHLEVNPNGQPQEMKDLDSFLNGYLRSLSDSDRQETLELITMIYQDAKSIPANASAQDIYDVFKGTMTDSKYSDDLARLLAYTIRYEQSHPEAAEGIKNVLSKFGLEGCNGAIDLVHNILNIKIEGPFGITIDFDNIMDIANGISGILKWDIVLDLISDKLFEATGIRFSHDELKKIIDLVCVLNAEMDKVEIKDGEDIIIPDSEQADEENYGGRNCSFTCGIREMMDVAATFNKIQKEFEAIAEDIVKKTTNLSFNFFGSVKVRNKLIVSTAETKSVADKMANLGTGLNNVTALVRNSEKRLLS